jgi:hypothetical protein
LDTSTYQDRLTLLSGRFVIELSGLDDLLVDIELVTRTRKHRLFDTLLRYKAIDAHDLCLANTMRTILSLKIRMRIPITVVTVEASAS